MSINFDQLPKDNPFALIPIGYYKFVVAKAEMKPNKDPAKKPFLVITFSLTDSKGNKRGNLFDRIMDNTTTPALLYKTGRFCNAIGVVLTGEVDLKDLAKLIVGKQGVLEVEHSKDTRTGAAPDAVQAQVKLFGSDCFWPLSEWDRLIEDAGTDGTTPATEESPFVFSDADGEVPAATAAPAASNTEY